MSGTGATFVVDKAWPVLATYNSSAAAGVTAFRPVKAASGGTIDLSVTDTDVCYGVVQENIDAAKVATGKAIAEVRMMGITRVYVKTATSIALGVKVTPSTDGGVKLAATGDVPLGIVVGVTGTPAEGDIIQILLTPGMPVL